MIVSGFNLGCKYTYHNFNWTAIKKKLKVNEINEETIHKLVNHISVKYSPIEMIPVSLKHDASIEDWIFHISIPIQEHISFDELVHQIYDIQESQQIKIYNRCLRYLGLTQHEPKLYSYAHRI